MNKDAAAERTAHFEVDLARGPSDSEPVSGTTREIEPEAAPETTPKKEGETAYDVFALARRACG